MSIAAALDSLVARLAAATPTTEADHGFYTLEDPASGFTVDVEDVPDEVVRLFDVRLPGLPADADSPGWPLCRWRMELDVRVRYPLHPRARWDRVIAADAVTIANALIHPGLAPGWDSSIASVAPPVPQGVTDVLSADGRVVARLAVHRFAVLVDVVPEGA